MSNVPVIRQPTDLRAVMGRILDQHGPQVGAALVVAALARDADQLRLLLDGLKRRDHPTPQQAA